MGLNEFSIFPLLIEQREFVISEIIKGIYKYIVFHEEMDTWMK